MGITSAIGNWFKTVFYETWSWFLMLNHQEWFVVLAVVAVFGGLCMRGFGSRNNV